jgi:hypothetical protein
MYLNAEPLSSPREATARVGEKAFHLTAAKQAPETPNTRLSVGDYIADILLDARHDGTLYHWIVQRVGSAAIIQWGQEYSFEEAYSAVKTYLENLSSTDKKKNLPQR